jgi:anti-sigma regulatory factor (Ser/Thr protein kinase)
MQDLSLHVLDIVENSIAAGAKNIKITINENIEEDVLTLTIQDNGKGIDKKMLDKVIDPFYSTKKIRRIGLGLSMLAQATKEADGSFNIESQKGKGTAITATFVHSHIDRKPIGNMADTLISLVVAKGMDVDFIYEHHRNGQGFIFDTKTIKNELKDLPLDDPEVITYLRNTLIEEFGKIEERSNR